MSPANVAIIGAGVRSIAFCDFIARANPEIARLTKLIDLNVAKAKVLNDYFKFDADITKNIDSVDDIAIDAVLISTPDYAHVAPTLAALKAGKHVYLEKPLATTLEDCDTIIHAAKDSNSICYLGFNLRHSPVYEKIYSLIQGGELGKITTIEANEWCYGGRTYFRRWNRLCKFGGGLWLTKACHDFDLITWIAGGKPISVYTTSSLSHYKNKPGAGPRCRDCKLKASCPDYYDINKPLKNCFEETWRQIQLKMDQDGDLAPDICLYNSEKDTFDNGMAVINYDNDIRAAYTVNVLAARTTRQMRVIGTKGMVEADMEKSSVILICRHTNTIREFDLSEQTQGSHGGADYNILSDFFRICRDGGTPRSSLTDGRLAVQIALVAIESSDVGHVIKITHG